MPVIQEYNAPTNLGLQTNDRAVDAKGIAARQVSRLTNEAASEVTSLGQRVGGTIAQVGNYAQDYEAHQEIRNGAAGLTQATAAKQQEWDEAIKQPGADNPAVRGKFMDHLEDTFDDFREGFSTPKGQEWAERRIEAIRDHFTKTTAVDQSTVTSIAAHNQHIQTVNTLGGMVNDNPANLSIASDLLKDNIVSTADSSPTMRGADAVKFKTDALQHGMTVLVSTAIAADIKHGGDGSKIANDPAYAQYVTPGERDKMVTMQRQEQRLATAEARNQAMWAKQQQQDTSDKTVIALVKDLFSDDPKTTRSTLNDLVDQQKMTRKDFEHVAGKQGLFETINKDDPPAKISQQTWTELGSRIYSATDEPGHINSPAEILAARNKGLLGRSDFKDLIDTLGHINGTRNDRVDKDVAEVVAAIKPQLDRSIVGLTLDTEGPSRLFKFKRDLYKEMELYKQQGKSPSVLLDPDSPEYFGNRVGRYVAPLDAQVRASVKGALNRVPAGQDGRPPLGQFDRSR